MNNTISVFKFGVIKSVETLSSLSICIGTVTCGRHVGICTVTHSLYSDPDCIVLHQAELMHSIAIFDFQKINLFIKF